MQTPRKQHYNFAYMVMPLMAFSKAKDTYSKLDRNDRINYLKSLWNGLGSKTREMLPDGGIACSKWKVEPNKVMFVITLPPPLIQPEAYHIGLLFTVKSSLFHTDVTDIRCFTLELSIDILTKRHVFVVGESLQTNNPLNYDHRNYGSIIQSDAESFVLAIEDLLLGRRRSALWFDPKKEESNRPISGKLEQLENEYDISEDDLEVIWNKWTNLHISKSVIDLCNKQVEPVIKLLHDLCMQCLDANIYPREQAEELGEWVGFAVSRLSRGSFMIGLEYPEFNPESQNICNEKPYKLLSIASDPSEKVLLMFLTKLVESGNLSISEAGNLTTSSANTILRSKVGCFALGTIYRDTMSA